MPRALCASLALAGLLGSVLSYQIGGYLPLVVALSMFEGFSLVSLSFIGAAIRTEGK